MRLGTTPAASKKKPCWCGGDCPFYGVPSRCKSSSVVSTYRGMWPDMKPPMAGSAPEEEGDD